MKNFYTPGGKYILNSKDIVEVVGPYPVKDSPYPPVSKYQITLRCTKSDYVFGYDDEKTAYQDVVYLDYILRKTGK